MEAAKDQVVTDLLFGITRELEEQTEEETERERRRRLENVIIAALRNVEVMAKQTALATERDFNEWMLKVMKTEMDDAEMSLRTIEQYEYATRSLIDYVDKDIRRITTADIKDYLNFYGRENASSTYNNQRQYLSAVFNWMVKNRMTEYNPVARIRRRKEICKPIDYLNEVEILILRQTCKSDRDAALFEFLLSTGVRVGEFVNIRRDQVDWREGTIRNVFAGKTSNYRDVFLTPVAEHLLKMYLDSRDDNNPYLFVSSKRPRKQLSEKAVEDILRRIGKRSGLNRRVYPHLCRHTFATMALARGARLEHIQQLLGHSSPVTTVKHYTGIVSGYLKNIHNQFCNF